MRENQPSQLAPPAKSIDSISEVISGIFWWTQAALAQAAL
jgi:hypothetical protein